MPLAFERPEREGQPEDFVSERPVSLTSRIRSGVRAENPYQAAVLPHLFSEKPSHGLAENPVHLQAVVYLIV